MLATAYKSKLPRGWSYPLGAADISEVLEPVEGAAPQPIRFRDRQIRSSTHKRMRQDDRPYPVLEVSYSRWLSASEHEYAAAHGMSELWQVQVNPVPSRYRAVLRQQLLTAGLPYVRKWLEQTRALATWRRDAFCRALYHEGYGRLIMEQRLSSFEAPSMVEIPAHEHGAG